MRVFGDQRAPARRRLSSREPATDCGKHMRTERDLLGRKLYMITGLQVTRGMTAYTSQKSMASM